MNSINKLKNYLIEYFKGRDVKIYLFGSCVKATKRKYFYIDIAIRSNEDLKDNLKEIIEECNLIYKVDLVELKKLDF